MGKILCGSKCIIWLLKEFNIPFEHIEKDLYFITDIANALIDNGINLNLYCYKSNLYNDYKSGELNIVSAINSINEYCSKNKIIEKHFTEQELIYELNDNYLILNVDSRIINNTRQNTGHFVIAKKENDKIVLINPEKTKFTEKIYNSKEIIKMCENNGNWRIQIRRKRK